MRLSRKWKALEFVLEGVVVVLAATTMNPPFVAAIATCVVAVIVIQVVGLVLDSKRLSSDVMRAQTLERKQIETAISLVWELVDLSGYPEVRITFLKANLSSARLEQCARVGGQLGQSTIGFGKGAAGTCYEDGQASIERVKGGDPPTHEEFISYMCKRGFTREEAKKFEIKKVYICSAVYRPGSNSEPPIGVVSMDFDTEDVFSTGLASMLVKKTGPLAVLCSYLSIIIATMEHNGHAFTDPKED